MDPAGLLHVLRQRDHGDLDVVLGGLRVHQQQRHRAGVHQELEGGHFQDNLTAFCFLDVFRYLGERVDSLQEKNCTLNQGGLVFSNLFTLETGLSVQSETPTGTYIIRRAHTKSAVLSVSSQPNTV